MPKKDSCSQSHTVVKMALLSKDKPAYFGNFKMCLVNNKYSIKHQETISKPASHLDEPLLPFPVIVI